MSTLDCVWGFSGVVSPHAENFPQGIGRQRFRFAGCTWHARHDRALPRELKAVQRAEILGRYSTVHARSGRRLSQAVHFQRVSLKKLKSLEPLRRAVEMHHPYGLGHVVDFLCTFQESDHKVGLVVESLLGSEHVELLRSSALSDVACKAYCRLPDAFAGPWQTHAYLMFQQIECRESCSSTT